MWNFKITFSYPWLLLLLIPAAALTVFLYLRLNKKYRRNRNRIISIILHSLVMLLCISVLAGIGFSFDVPNTTNEVILLVDASHSESSASMRRDEFVKSAIEASGSAFRLGIVTFGYDQVYAVEFSDRTADMYEKYLSAEKPDDSATDIASALRFAGELFNNPASGKIVLITDGVETDGDAATVIRSVASKGIRVDAVDISGERGGEVQISGVVLPDYNIAVGDEFNIQLTIDSSIEGAASLTLYDNDEQGVTMPLELKNGSQTVNLGHSFTSSGMHEIHFALSADNDGLAQNNTYYTYIYLEAHDRVLIIERTPHESDELAAILAASDFVEGGYNVDTVYVNDAESMPVSVEQLRQYDEIVLMNIANSDMPAGFDVILNSYVHEVGGGLFTVGGNKTDASGETVANTYNREDMFGTIYQEMLPVQAIRYTPPIAVMIVIDRSSSMMAPDAKTGKTKLELAKDGAKACLNALSERDYCGVMTLEDSYREEVQLTPVTQRSKIINAIDNIVDGEGGTVFSGAIDQAGLRLSSQENVEKRHVILVTDGEPSDEDPLYGTEGKNGYGDLISLYNQTHGITFSIVAIDTDEEHANAMREASETLGGGKFYSVFDSSTLPRIMREDLAIPEIRDYNDEPFVPVIAEHTSIVSGVDQQQMPVLNGYYGTRLKEGANAPLMGTYVPVYAQWKYGEGTVGSFMCDLSGNWSAEFLNSDAGIRIINNIVNALFPKGDIRAHDIDVRITEDNYGNRMSVFTQLEEGETLRVSITGPPETEGGEKVVTELETSAVDNSSRRVTFEVRTPGVHEILITKLTADGSVKSQFTAYKVFSYSEEYNAFIDAEAGSLNVSVLAEKGNGAAIKEPWEIYRDFVKSVHVDYDPRIPFMITAIILFVLDVAVRKFKFKWLHEIIRDRKLKNEDVEDEKR